MLPGEELVRSEHKDYLRDFVDCRRFAVHLQLSSGLRLHVDRLLGAEVLPIAVRDVVGDGFCARILNGKIKGSAEAKTNLDLRVHH